jgi:hypothetical protein
MQNPLVDAGRPAQHLRRLVVSGAVRRDVCRYNSAEW